MPHVCLGTKGFALLAPAAQIKADEVFTLPQGLFACGGGSQASKGCAGAACLRAPTADVESLPAPGAPAAVGAAVGMGTDRMPLGNAAQCRDEQQPR